LENGSSAILFAIKFRIIIPNSVNLKEKSEMLSIGIRNTDTNESIIIKTITGAAKIFPSIK
jgi:hypothetical protein